MNEYLESTIKDSNNFTIIKATSQLMKKVRTAVLEGILDPVFNAQKVAKHLKKNNILNPDGSNLTREQVDHVCYNYSLGENSGDHPSTDLMVTNMYEDAESYDYAFRNFDWDEESSMDTEKPNQKTFDTENERRYRDRENIGGVA